MRTVLRTRCRIHYHHIPEWVHDALRHSIELIELSEIIRHPSDILLIAVPKMKQVDNGHRSKCGCHIVLFKVYWH